jgi:hypothetical protein
MVKGPIILLSVAAVLAFGASLFGIKTTIYVFEYHTRIFVWDLFSLSVANTLLALTLTGWLVFRLIKAVKTLQSGGE